MLPIYNILGILCKVWLNPWEDGRQDECLHLPLWLFYFRNRTRNIVKPATFNFSAGEGHTRRETNCVKTVSLGKSNRILTNLPNYHYCTAKNLNRIGHKVTAIQSVLVKRIKAFKKVLSWIILIEGKILNNPTPSSTSLTLTVSCQNGG